MKTSAIIAVIGTPLSGKSTLALNLAAAYAQQHHNALWIDFLTGDCFIVTPSGAQKTKNVSLSPAALNEIQKDFFPVIIDMGTAPLSQTILQMATAILVPTEAKPQKLFQTRELLSGLYTVLPRDLIYVVLNKYSAEDKINASDIKKQLGCDILGAIALDETLPSLNRFESFVFSNPKGLAAKYVFQLLKTIQTNKILEKGAALQKRREKIVPLRPAAERFETPTSSPVKTAAISRFEKEELPRDPKILLKRNILKQLSSELNLKKLDTETGNDPKKMALLRQKTKQAVEAIMEREKMFVGGKTDKEQFIKEILDEALALGPLEELLADPAITEIMVNNKDQIYIEKNGRVSLSPSIFTSNAQLLGIIERIVAPLGRRIDEKTPYVDARLPDGSRVHAIIPPLALKGPTLTIRKFPEKNFEMRDLIRFGSVTEEIADFLRAAVETRLNCVISGGTGSGKTTLLNILSSFIPDNDRIVTIEDSAELRLPQPHVVQLESRPPNIEGSGAVTIRDLVKNTLRMRPDRIIVGECRDGAALDMLQAMNTGHDGSLTTIHANSPRDCLSRLETLVMMAGMDLPSRAIREQIGSAIHLIIQQSRLADGSRKITHICEVTGMEKEIITLADVMIFKQQGIDHTGKVIGKFEFTGYVPRFIHDLEKKGLRVPKGFFTKKPAGSKGG